MAKFEDKLKCSFCGKGQDQVRKLIAGPGVYICDECIELCNEILAEEFFDSSATGNTAMKKPFAPNLKTGPIAAPNKGKDEPEEELEAIDLKKLPKPHEVKGFRIYLG